jgi:hypothetical protein
MARTQIINLIAIVLIILSITIASIIIFGFENKTTNHVKDQLVYSIFSNFSDEGYIEIFKNDDLIPHICFIDFTDGKIDINRSIEVPPKEMRNITIPYNENRIESEYRSVVYCR